MLKKPPNYWCSMLQQQKMSKTEKRAISSLALIYAFRMLGLFMILPVFSVYAETLKLSTPFLIGLTMGVYGLTQVCLQIPFGWLSDKIGRKPVIVVGLLLFALGSIVAGLSNTIYGVLIGRAIQGMGAISSATMALLGDVTQEENRTKAMASIGMTIGLSFAASVVLGPFLNQYVGVSGIFFVTAGFAIIGIIILQTLVPTKNHWTVHHDTEARLKELPAIFFNKALAQLNVGIFIQHAILTSTFVVMPLMFKNLNVSMTHEWMIALPVIILAFALSIPLIIVAEVKRKIKLIFSVSIVLLIIAELGCWVMPDSGINLTLFLWIFFTAFCALEALLPSMVSKVAPAGLRGTAMGLYTTNQFLGIFVGGVFAGWVCQQYAITDVLFINAVLLCVWLAVAFFMRSPRYVSTCVFPLTYPYPSREQCLTIPGVIDVAICPDERVVYLKIDKDICDMSRLQSQLNLFK